MSEQSSSNPAEVQAPAQEPTKEPAKVDETDWKAEARKWEQRAKENTEARKRLDEIEEQSKTELQKATERAEQAERRAAEVELSATRYKVAAEKGVPANLLNGSTEAELIASADALIAFRGEQQSQRTADPVVPGEGVSPSPLALNGDPLERALKDKLGIA